MFHMLLTPTCKNLKSVIIKDIDQSLYIVCFGPTCRWCAIIAYSAVLFNNDEEDRTIDMKEKIRQCHLMQRVAYMLEEI